jgi:hypothetical protein
LDSFLECRFWMVLWWFVNLDFSIPNHCIFI